MRALRLGKDEPTPASHSQEVPDSQDSSTSASLVAGGSLEGDKGSQGGPWGWLDVAAADQLLTPSYHA